MEFKQFHLPLLLVLLISIVSAGSLNAASSCNSDDHDSTLRVFHMSPFRSRLSWSETILQMQADDQTRIVYLSSLAAGKSFVPIGSGRQMMQSPTYIVKAKIGTPAQMFLMALDTSTDMALLPSTGCLGCASSSNPFAFAKSALLLNANRFKTRIAHA